MIYHNRYIGIDIIKMRTAHLREIVLNCLQQCPDSGYGIIVNIKNSTGWKPSTGSIYPLLNQMKTEGLLGERKTKKKNIYYITTKGEETLKELKKNHEKIIEEMKKIIKILGRITGQDCIEIIEEMEKQLREGKAPFEEIFEESLRLKKNIARISKEGKMRKNADKINQILIKTNKELEKI